MAGPMHSAPAIARTATGIGLVALATGLLAQYLFVDAALGINVPIATAALLLAGWVARDPASAPPRLVDAWLAPAALILSAFVALRGDGTMVALDVLGAIALSGAALASFGGLRADAAVVLAAHGIRLQHDEPGKAWQAWNLSREQARAATDEFISLSAQPAARSGVR
jgi:hypothetical protein